MITGTVGHARAQYRQLIENHIRTGESVRTHFRPTLPVRVLYRNIGRMTGEKMGRTVPTYRMTAEMMIDSWKDYRRALPQDDREVFDRMVNRIRMHASASTYAIFNDPFEGAVLSMLLEQEKELAKLRREAAGHAGLDR